MSDMFSLEGRRIVVTGAAEGLGKAFARAICDRGGAAICVDINPMVDDTVRELVAAGGIARAVVADVADEASVQRLASSVAAKEGALDGLVNNAGIAIPPGRLLDVAIENWDRVLRINVRSVFLCSQALLPFILKAGGGSVVNLGSFLGEVGAYPGFPITAIPYAASKAAVDGFTRQLAAEYAADGVRVNAIAPGWHAGTNLGRERKAATDPGSRDRFNAFTNASIPAGRWGQPEEITGLLIYLLSDASRYMTGQIIAHDGGLTAV